MTFNCKLCKAVIAGLFVAALLAVTGATAQAETYKFYSGGVGYTGPYSGAGTVYDVTKGLSTDCTIESGCVEVIASSLSFAGSDGPVTATANATNKVWDDYTPIYAGIGVDTIANTSSGDDQIEGTEVLTFSFLSNVKLLGVGTLFQDSHSPFGAGFANAAAVNLLSGTISFLLSLDGGGFFSYTFADANNIALSLTAKTFSFMQQTGNPTFYVSALITGPADSVPQVPIPAALPLFLGGLGVLTLMRRRKRNQTARAA